MRTLLALSLSALLYGCGAPVYRMSSELSKISIGMSKAEVISAMGEPSRVSASEGAEFLIYRLVDRVDRYPRRTSRNDYFVKLQDNRVVAFGRFGDFAKTALTRSIGS